MIDLIFYLPTPLLLISGIPQTLALLKRKTSDDISIITYMMTWIAVVLITIKAAIAGENEIMIANLVSTTTLSLNLFLTIYYRF